MNENSQPAARAAKRPWCPAEMRWAPLLDATIVAGPVTPRYALLINPFYPKDPNASFGKHVLTPTLALTSFAATTPDEWDVQYWDENLLDGRPPFIPMPEVVGITVHLTFAKRAFELAQWYRKRGSKVVLGGLHVQSDWRAVAPYLAMSYLYKRSNRFWQLLIKHHLVHAIWRPLIELTRLRHVRFREELAARTTLHRAGACVVAPGV